MTGDELERAALWLRQGLDLPRETQVRLVAHALGAAPTPHARGCAFHRGEGCDCRGEPGPMELAVREALGAG